LQRPPSRAYAPVYGRPVYVYDPYPPPPPVAVGVGFGYYGGGCRRW
jgi:hypothetical protein